MPPILREAILEARPEIGDHLLVYFNAGWALLTPNILAVLAALRLPVIVYGAGRSGRRGSIVFKDLDETRFVEDLATCRAVLATGGHQLIAEAIRLRKPMLLCPEDSAEQRLNAREAERLGFARCVRHGEITAATLQAFLRDLDGMRAAVTRLEIPHSATVVHLLEEVAAELVGLSAPCAPVPADMAQEDNDATRETGCRGVRPDVAIGRRPGRGEDAGDRVSAGVDAAAGVPCLR